MIYFFFFLSWLFSAAAFGQGQLLMPGALDRLSISFEHGYVAAPASSSQEIAEQEASVSVPLYDGEDSDLALIARGQKTNLGESLRFSEAEIPDVFSSADFGIAWSREDLSGDKVGLKGTYGSSGARLFSADSKAILSATLFIERKKESGDSWLYFLSYSNSRTTLNNIPIPGLAYLKVGRDYRAVFGIPFVFLSWRPGRWTISGSISPFGVSANIGLPIHEAVGFYTSLNWSPESYQDLFKGRDERLILDKKEAEGGLRLRFGRRGSLTAGYVYTFDRRFLLAESISDNDKQSISMSDSAGFRIKGSWTF